MNKYIKLFIIFILTFLIIACDMSTGGGGFSSTDSEVDIKNLSAKVVNNQEQSSKLNRKNKNGNEEVGSIKEQYIVMYKNETEIEFTIELNNPKASSIDAVEIYCDDPDSEIMMDNKYEKIQHSENKSIVMNWGQENPYKKTFTIKTTKQSDVIILKVLDIKIDGKWKMKNFSNDTLEIIKIGENDFVWNFITNVPKYYKWSIDTNKTLIDNVVFKMDDEVIEPAEDGVYTVEKNGTVTYEFDIFINDKTYKANYEKEIELFWIEYPENDKYFDYHMQVTLDDLCRENIIYIGPFDFHGTDIEDTKDELYKVVVNDSYTFEEVDVRIQDRIETKDKYKGMYISLTSDYSFMTYEYQIEKVALYINGHFAGNFKTHVEWLASWSLGRNVFEVKYVDYDGTIIKTEYVLYMQNSTPPHIPDDAREGYIFVGWNGNYNEVSSNLIITAKYREDGVPTAGLRYELSEDGTYYIIVGNSSNEKSIEIPATYKGLPVKEIKQLFLSGIYNIIISEGIEKIHSGACISADTIRTVKLPSTLKEIGYSFVNGPECAVEEFIIPDENPYFTSVDGVLYTKDMKTLVAYPTGRIKDTIEIPEGVETIAYKLFTYCNHAPTLKLPNSIKKIEEGAFMGCRFTNIYFDGTVEELLSVNVESTFSSSMDMNNKHIFVKENGSYVELINLVVPGTVKYVGKVLAGFNIQNVYFEEGVETIGKSAFNGCKNLYNVYLPKTLTKIEAEAFYTWNGGPKYFYYEGTLEEWNNIIIENGEHNLSSYIYLYIKNADGEWEIVK